MWCKNLDVNSSNWYCTLELGLVNEYNTQVWFNTLGLDVGLSNHIKNEFVNSLLLSLYFKYFNYILVIIFI
jgi:hypothetical protein